MSHLDFLNKFQQKFVKDNLIYLALHGSKAYGTNIETSDDDYRGITIPPKEYYLGYLNTFEQAELKDPDVTIFGINKFFKLAQDCNPNCLEIIFVDPSDVLFVSPIGQEILDNRNLLLSKKVKFTMTGYAISQLHRIQLHRKYFTNPPKAPPTRADFNLPEYSKIPKDHLDSANALISRELDKFQLSFLDHLSDSERFEAKQTMENMLSILKITKDDQYELIAKQIGFDDNIVEILKQEKAYASTKQAYDQFKSWEKNRNPKRAEQERKYGIDLKHSLHLVRLFRQCRELLTTGKLNVKRHDREELLAIRNGAWTYDQLLEYAKKEEEDLIEIYKNCTILPKEPDRVKLNNLCIKLIERSFK